MPVQRTSGSVAMGVLCAAIGALSGVAVAAGATGEGYQWFLVAAPLAAFLTGSGLWYLVMARPGRSGTGWGVATGALAGGLAHFVCWYLLLVGAFACNVATGGCTDSLGQPPMNPAYAFAGAAGYSAFSLLFLGWLTVPAGALVGGLLAFARRRRAGGEIASPPLGGAPLSP